MCLYLNLESFSSWTPHYSTLEMTAFRFVCPALCAGENREFLIETLPVCWELNLNAELVRRGYTFELGQKIRGIGPVVNNYSVKILVQRLGQIEILDED